MVPHTLETKHRQMSTLLEYIESADKPTHIDVYLNATLHNNNNK